MNIRTSVIAGLLALACPMTGQAWDNAGHETVAAVALRQMQADARQGARRAAAKRALARLNALLQNDPRGRRSLEAASVWPDEIKHRGDRDSNTDPVTNTYKDPSWHFVDIPYALNGQSADDVINRPGVTVDPSQDASANVVTGIRYYQKTLRAGGGDAAQTVDAVSWLAHLVGDVHQPLHAVTVEAPIPGYAPPASGDRGGNGFLLEPADHPHALNLHAYWDDQLDPAQRRALTPAQADALARQLMAGRHRPAPTLDPAAWAKESYALRQRVYATPVGQRPSASYAAWAKKTASDRIVAAGRRLAALLEEALGR